MAEDDYDVLRQKNISERNAIFAEFFKELKEQTSEIKKQDAERAIKNNSEDLPPKKKRKRVSDGTESFKSGNVRLEFRRKYNTRNNKKVRMLTGISESFRDNRPRLQVLFPWAKPFERTIELMKIGVCDVDQEEEEEGIYDDDFLDIDTRKRKKYSIGVRRSKYDLDSIPSVDEITEDMLDNVAKKSSTKTYCKIKGTCCHQCRQKTLDTKTVCRSGECIGVRGQFCGPCLQGRYGESAIEALKDPNWACPPCRELCNCSICRVKCGLRPTGMLAPLAQEEGYSSVMDYLQAAEVEDM